MKTIVNIVSIEEPLAAYLFCKELYSQGDHLLFIAARHDAPIIERTVGMLGADRECVDSVVLDRDSDAIAYELICRKVITHLDLLHDYHVNLAGGSRYMALAVKQVFSQFHSTFYYTQTRENVIVKTIYDNSIYDNDDQMLPIRHRSSLSEYLQLHGLQHDLDHPDQHLPIRPKSYTDHLFTLFANGTLTNNDHQTLTDLRLHYRNERRSVNIARLVAQGCYRRPPLPHLITLLQHLDFRPHHSDMLSHEEIEYLTGGWFEEYVYHLIKKQVRPQDIAIGVRIARPGTKHNNELDVAFVKANTFYVIECKTGVCTTHLFNEVVYKACALKEALLGTGCHSYIFSLKKDPDHYLSKVAQTMDIVFCSHEVLTHPKRLKKVAEKIRHLSHEA